MNPRFVIYRDKSRPNRQLRWKLVIDRISSGNSLVDAMLGKEELIACSGDGFDTEAEVQSEVKRVQAMAPFASVIVDTFSLRF